MFLQKKLFFIIPKTIFLCWNHANHVFSIFFFLVMAFVFFEDRDPLAYLAKPAGPVPLVLDLRIIHDRFGSISDPSLNGHLHYPNDIEKSLTVVDKIRNITHTITTKLLGVSFMTPISSTSGRLRNWHFFFGVHHVEHDRGLFHFRYTVVSTNLKVKVGTPTKTTVVRVHLNIDGTPITSKTHTRPSHTQTSTLSLGPYSWFVDGDCQA